MALLALVAVGQVINSYETFWMFSIGINNVSDIWFERPCTIKIVPFVRSIEERFHSCLNNLMSVILPINQEHVQWPKHVLPAISRFTGSAED